ncbi:MAG TPA: NAD(P)H-hydrate epimerase [Phycisphaerae bacterium]|nr:NAD(P)H-hydrate epimerase [Phycisphaerae bacterium]
MNEPARTRDEIRALDRWAMETLGVAGIVLMENAGRQIAEAARAMIAGKKNPRVLILAGPGNNGGDGFVAARHLAAVGGVRAEVVLLAPPFDMLRAALSPSKGMVEGPREKMTGDAATNLAILEAMDLSVRVLVGEAEEMLRELRPMLAGADLVVDGLLGTGTRGKVREPFASVIRAVNDAGRPVLAIDIPSGLDPDTGEPLGPTIRAARTVTMAARKVGFERPGAADYTGEVTVADIGVPVTRLRRGGKD